MSGNCWMNRFGEEQLQMEVVMFMKARVAWTVLGFMSLVLLVQAPEAITVGAFSEGIRVGVLYKCSLKVKKLGGQKSTEC